MVRELCQLDEQPKPRESIDEFLHGIVTRLGALEVRRRRSRKRSRIAIALLVLLAVGGGILLLWYFGLLRS
jgi:hypothetical protein